MSLPIKVLQSTNSTVSEGATCIGEERVERCTHQHTQLSKLTKAQQVSLLLLMQFMWNTKPLETNTTDDDAYMHMYEWN